MQLTTVTMQLPEASVGWISRSRELPSLTHDCGTAGAIEIICLGNEANAARLRRIGAIIQDTFAPNELLNAVMEIARKMDNKGPLAIKGAKRVGCRNKA
jgi:enoyl-CoA hydratase/carnithine racemase